MKIAFYPGSFNPWHEGHLDILKKASQVFDKIVILQLTNPEKGKPKRLTLSDLNEGKVWYPREQVSILWREETFLTTVIGNYILGIAHENHQYAIIRGLRNGNDLEYEKAQQFWNEDLGMKIPFVYFVADRKYAHISSSAIRQVNKLMELQNARNTSSD